MTGPPPAVAAVRVAVRAALREQTTPGDLVLVACSGGPDSLALLEAACFVVRGGHPVHGGRLRVGAVIVDHGLQQGSRQVAEATAVICRELGAAPVEVVPVEVRRSGDGPEAEARAARYRALEQQAQTHRARLVLLGHTLDDQAEQVLLGLVRGSGARSLAGMPARRGLFVRPLLGLPRATVHASLTATAWHDPSNADPGYLRSRVRTRVLPALEAELGPGVSAALARTAEQLREDADLLDTLAGAAYAEAADADGLALASLAGQPPALRRRVLRRWLLDLGCPATATGRSHVLAVEALLTGWRGQRGVDLPGGVSVVRSSGRLVPVRRG